jgi:hypothetical protein
MRLLSALAERGHRGRTSQFEEVQLQQRRVMSSQWAVAGKRAHSPGGTASDYARGNATVQLLQFHLGSAWQTAAHGDGKTAETEDIVAFLPRVCVCRPSRRGHGGSQWTRREDDSVW